MHGEKRDAKERVEEKKVEHGHLVPQRVLEMNESQTWHTSRLLFRETESRLEGVNQGETLESKNYSSLFQKSPKPCLPST